MSARPRVGAGRRPPSVDALARSLARSGLPHPLLVDAARAALARADAGSAADEAELIRARVVQPVINGTGVLRHTNLGRAPLESHQTASYTSLELDFTTGRRGSRQARVGPLLAAACGAEAALVVNNGASAVLVVLAALAAGRTTAVSRGELIEIGGGFCIPEIMALSGTRLAEVGTTNRTRLDDYRPVADEASLLLKVHTSNYKIARRRRAGDRPGRPAGPGPRAPGAQAVPRRGAAGHPGGGQSHGRLAGRRAAAARPGPSRPVVPGVGVADATLEVLASLDQEVTAPGSYVAYLGSGGIRGDARYRLRPARRVRAARRAFLGRDELDLRPKEFDLLRVYEGTHRASSPWLPSRWGRRGEAGGRLAVTPPLRVPRYDYPCGGAMRSMPVTVALAHGQEVFRRGLEAMLDAIPGVDARAYETVDELVADAIVTGWARISVVDVEVLRPDRGAGRLAPSAVVVVVPSAEAAHVAVAAQVGADGYVLLADLSVGSLELALREVAAGHRYVPERLAPMLERWAPAGTPRADGRHDVLSPRESQVVELLVHGHSNKEISRLLGISIHSTKRHVSSILSKLDSPSRSHVVSSVLRGMVTLGRA